MYRYFYGLLFAILVLSVTGPLEARKTFSGGRHSYPKSGGLSGGGSHSYPSSGGLSGGGHGYPSSGGSHGYPSGGSHGYPSGGSGGSHSYPAGGGLSGGGSGYPSGGSANRYPSSGGSHTYPTSGGSHSYPQGKGLSGNSHSSGSGSGHTTNIHYHYNYNPPKQIRYIPPSGGPAVSYPVYHGTPPTYVYQYKDSGSKYGTLLAGLALLNLGTLAGGAYALSKSHSATNYKPQPGEFCKFAVKHANGDYEETKIDCQLITSFIFEDEAKRQTGATGTNTTVITTVTNVTTINGPSTEVPTVGQKMLYEMLPNGTLVPVNVTNVPVNTTNDASNNTMTSSVTITTTNTTVTNALDVKGKPVDVTPGMQCYVMRHSPTSNMKKSVPCRLLQTYADSSLKKNSASKNIPTLTILTVIVGMLVFH